MENGKYKGTMVLSGINLFEGGPLSIYYDCMNSVRKLRIYEKYHVVAFVHKRELFKDYEDIASIIELPKSRKNYLYRLYYEYIYFGRISERKRIDFWISLHDITPRVKSRRLYTYCHNPTPFMKKDISKIRYSLRNVLMSLFYKYLYRINIKAADGIIVQSEWMRKAFLDMYPIKNVIVARPRFEIDYENISKQATEDEIKNIGKKIFIYAGFPRFFKNFEVICEAANILNRARKLDYEVWLTIDGTENRYSFDVHEKYETNPHIKWLGIQQRSRLFELYKQSDCMIFSSKLETWGLPISEYKYTGKDMIIVDLPYAHETLGTYDKVMFFNEDDSNCLADKMLQVIQGTQRYQPQVEITVSKPYAESWDELMEMMIERL